MSLRGEPRRAYKPRAAAVTSAMMATVRATENKAEVALRRALWRLGFRYRLYQKALPGRPDLVFGRNRTVVFVDGDFWHGRHAIEKGVDAFSRTLRTPRKDWWIAKITRTIERDGQVSALLAQQGWTVVRLWESDVLANVHATARATASTLRKAARLTEISKAQKRSQRR